jgi:hypothetical protein
MTLNPVIEPPFIHPPNPGHLLYQDMAQSKYGPSPMMIGHNAIPFVGLSLGLTSKGIRWAACTSDSI